MSEEREPAGGGTGSAGDSAVGNREDSERYMNTGSSAGGELPPYEPPGEFSEGGEPNKDEGGFPGTDTATGTTTLGGSISGSFGPQGKGRGE